MALEFLDNPRKAPRIRARCEVSATAGGVRIEGHTEDFGPHGCQLVSPRPVARGSGVQLVLRADASPLPLEVAGTVAWASPQPPFRLGVAFAEGARPAATRFFDLLVAAQPGLAAWRRVPDRISYDAMVWLAPPPRLVVDFSAEEVAVLRAVGTGATVFELKSRLRDRWAVSQRALFSLLTGQFVTLSRGGAVPYANWSNLLHELEAEVAAASLAEQTGPIASAARPPPPPPPPRPAPAAPGGRYAGATSSPRGTDGSAGLDMDPEALELDLTPRHPGAGTGPGWSGGPRRPGEAEEAWQQALLELGAGRQLSAVALLRRALALAPGDPEIARKLGEVTSGRG